MSIQQLQRIQNEQTVSSQTECKQKQCDEKEKMTNGNDKCNDNDRKKANVCGWCLDEKEKNFK